MHEAEIVHHADSVAGRGWPAWRVELERQERSLGWLARKTGKSASAVSRYAHGSLPTPVEWIRQVERILGVEFAA